MNYVEQRLSEIKKTHELEQLAALRRYRNVSTETTRHGKKVFYYRIGKERRIRLPDPATVRPDVFNQAYLAARRGEASFTPQGGRPVKMPSLSPTVGRRGFVYFLRMGETVKIGFATNVASRMKSLQTSCSEPTEILNVIPGTDQTERYFHAHFEAYRQKGEWFRLEGALAAFLAVGAKAHRAP
jgi:hypothetical protein